MNQGPFLPITLIFYDAEGESGLVLVPVKQIVRRHIPEDPRRNKL
jgi:hypothetical protein